MRETTVEATFKWLEGFGFLALKLTTPGYNGVMDRMILNPTWSPCPPVFVETKAPKKGLRKLQAEVDDNWRKRGVNVRDFVDTVEKAKALCDSLLFAAVMRVPAYERMSLPPHIRKEYHRIYTERQNHA